MTATDTLAEFLAALARQEHGRDPNTDRLHQMIPDGPGPHPGNSLPTPEVVEAIREITGQTLGSPGAPPYNTPGARVALRRWAARDALLAWSQPTTPRKAPR